jgi:hypothetical protein
MASVGGVDNKKPPLYWHMAKATFRLPDRLLDELRSRSEREERSLNSVAVDVLWRGLGHDAGDDAFERVFGSLIFRPATRAYDPELLAGWLSEVPVEKRDLSDALEWTRGD